MRELLSEIEAFKNWAKTADKSFGEWETEYHHWDRIYKFVIKLIENVPAEEWSLELLNQFLYILARDNERERIIETLIDNPTQLLHIAKQSVSFPEQDARWQIAYGLGEINERDQEIKPLLKKFLNDEKEYVRKRASFAIENKGMKM